MSALNAVLENDAGVKAVEIDGVGITVHAGFTVTLLNGDVIVDDGGGSPSLLTAPVAVTNTTNAKLYGRGRVQIKKT